jgi:hypothetical protein
MLTHVVTYNQVTSLYVTAFYSTYSPSIPQPSGTLSITANGTALANCTNLTATSQTYACKTDALVKLDPASYTLRAEFSPNETSALNYNSAFGTMPYNVLPRVEGLLFNDLNRDNIRDEAEELASYADIGLDLGCTGSYVYEYAYGGEFSIETSPGSEYCLTVRPYGNWRSTRDLPIKFTVEGYENQYFEIGIYDTIITINPETLPYATVGVPYSQKFEVNGGTGNYTVTVSEGSILPEGITLDEATLTLSGTPTNAGYNYFELVATDTEGMKGYWSSDFHVFAEGTFTLESSNKSSTIGEEVTFTFSGSGDIMFPEYNEEVPMPPVGMVTFYIGDSTTPIESCREVLLNYDMDNDIPTDKPVVCITSALAEGSHDIKAVFTSTWLYLDATRTLTQTVLSPTTITIGPDMLATAAYQTPYSQELTASGGLRHTPSHC